MNIIMRPAAVGNYRIGRINAIRQVTFHHIVGDAPAAIARFQTPGEEVSANYVIGSDGTVYQCVREQDTAYCDANFDSNTRTISIEHAGGLPSVPYTDAMYKASIALCADLVRRYGITDFKRHRDVSSIPTACPGQLDVERIVNAAKQGGDEVIPTRDLLNALFRNFRGRDASDAEAERYINSVTYNDLIPSLDSGDEHNAYVDAAHLGQVAKRDDWLGQINSLTAKLAAVSGPDKIIITGKGWTALWQSIKSFFDKNN
jgi:hypothetical protein